MCALLTGRLLYGPYPLKGAVKKETGFALQPHCVKLKRK